MTTQGVYRWRGQNGGSLEVLRLERLSRGIRVRSDIVVAGSKSFAISYVWLLNSKWRTRSLQLHVRDAKSRDMMIERTGKANWSVDGRDRNDLRGCEEIDLSVTPFCNTLALLRFGPPPGAAGELTTLYVGFPELMLTPSRQRYERISQRKFRYIDLGAYKGFRARLTVEADGMVRDYEGLFERLD